MIKSIIPYLFFIDRKLLKYFSVFLICLFGFIGFSSAGYTRQIGNYGYNPYIQSFDVNLTRSGNPLTNNLGYTKQIFVLYQSSSEFCAWFWNDGLPYNYCRRGRFKQGNIQSYQTCNEILSVDNSTMPGSCVTSDVGDGTKEVIKTFINSLTTSDYYYFNYRTTDFAWGDFCISSHTIGKSFCFKLGSNSSFTDTLNLTGGLNFDSIPTSVLENPFDNSGGGNSGINVEGSYSSLSGNVVYAPCTNGAVLNYYREIGYNDSMCYGGLDTFDNLTGQYIAVPGYGKTVFEIYENTRSYGVDGFQDFKSWFSEVKNIYDGVMIGRYSSSVLSSYPTVLKTYFELYYQYNSYVETDVLYHYCTLLLNTDLNKQSDFALFTKYARADYDYICGSVSNNGDSNMVGSGVGVGSDWSGIGSSTGSNNWNGTGNNVDLGSGSTLDTGFVIYDGINFISDYFNTLKKNFKNPNGSFAGILPNYIIVFLLAIIFFNFIRK